MIRPLHLILLAIAALTTLVPALLVAYGPTVRPAPRRAAAMPPRRVVSQAETPPIEPMAFVELPADEARAFNASVPFVDGPIPPARPFRFSGADEDRGRAVDCLAAAVIYEAGDDAPGEQAVAQVVLNRLRHPVYPKTVCGVVFQGSERRTGCQFTVTCDGALDRWSPSPAGWARAQAVAAAALNGKVVRPVGWATHYHTTYVVPYWQSSLDKIAAVGTHLFFRWTGYWGTPGAFHNPGARPEPAIAKMAKLSDLHRDGAGLTDEEIAAAVGLPEEADGAPTPVAGDPNSFLVTLPANTSAALYPSLAAQACGERTVCKFSAWADASRTPITLPLAPEQIATMSFAYLRDRGAGVERTLWNCAQTPRPDKRECMRVQVLAPRPAATPTPQPSPTPSPTTAPKAPIDLDSVRRKAPTPVSPAVRPPVTANAPATRPTPNAKPTAAQPSPRP